MKDFRESDAVPYTLDLPLEDKLMHKKAMAGRLYSIQTVTPSPVFFFGFNPHGPDTKELRTVHW